MDDFYKECQERLQNATDSAATVRELVGISIQDLPKVQLSKFAEQAVTLLSITFQNTACPTPEMVSMFKTIHDQLEKVVEYMEYILEAQVKFPGTSTKPPDDRYWV